MADMGFHHTNGAKTRPLYIEIDPIPAHAVLYQIHDGGGEKAAIFAVFRRRAFSGTRADRRRTDYCREQTGVVDRRVKD